MNSAVDFFKHADRDADAILEVDEAVNELVIMLAIKDFVDLGNRLSVEMIAFNTWCCFIMPDMFQATFREEINNTIGETDWPRAPRAEQLELGRQFLNRGRRAGLFNALYN